MIDEDKLNALELFGENEYLYKEIERLKEELQIEKATNKELLSTGADLENKLYEEQDKNKRLNNIINELEKCLQNYIYAIEPRGCSINYNCEYDSEEDYINAMKEQSKLNTFKFILDKIKELKGVDKE